MIKLRKDIQIYSTNKLVAESIHLSSGTSKVIEGIRDSIPYGNQAFTGKHAFLPNTPWREPNLHELRLLGACQPIPEATVQQQGTWIRILRVPDQILAPLESLGMKDVTTLDDYRTVLAEPDYDQAVAQVVDYFRPFCIEPIGLQVLGAALQAPGLTTVSFDPINKHYVGMHLDSWDRLPLERRHESRNRVSVNVGREARFLLFINLSLRKMFSILNISDCGEREQAHWETRVGGEFMERYPAYPVVRLRIEPKEAYIAPTENMLHDGCTLGMQHPDISLHMLGHFDSSPQAEGIFSA